MKKVIRIEASHPKLLKIYYDLGNICNYKCWYCFPGSNEGTTPWPDVDVIKKNTVHLINYYLESGIVDDIELQLLGGEPTLWSKLGDFIKYVSTNTKCRINVLTNGSRTIRWWNEYAEYFNHIGISVHHESANIDHIVELGNLLYDKDISFHTSVLMDHTHWDKCVGLVNQLANTENKWVVLAKSVHINGITSHFTEDQTQYLSNQIKRYPSDEYINRHSDTPRKKYIAHYSDGTLFETMSDHYFMLNMLNRYKGWECTLGINSLFINRNGSLSGTCNQLLYGMNYHFNLSDPSFITEFSPEIKPVICGQSICMCPGEAALTKRKLS